MLNKVCFVLAATALAAISSQSVHAQKNYTDGGDVYSGSRTDKTTDQSPTRSGKFDPYTEGRKQSSKAGLTRNQGSAQQEKESTKSGKSGPYGEGAKTGKFDPYTEGMQQQDKSGQ